jgi:hypothetical protein
MFAIKVYDHGSMDYSVYSADEYRVEDSPSPTGRIKTILLDYRKCTSNNEPVMAVHVESPAYVMNSEGKTIDTIYPT